MDKAPLFFGVPRIYGVICHTILAFCLLGCTRTAIYTSVLEQSPSSFVIPSVSQVKSSNVSRVILASPDTTWARMARMVVASAFILKIREGDHLVYFMKLDGFYRESKLYFAEFPMVAYLEALSDSSTKVYVLPLSSSDQLPESRAIRNSYLQVQGAKAMEFLDHLSAEIECKVRWPWLLRN